MKRRSHVTAKHTLLTDTWTAQVQALETAVGRFEAGEPLMNECQVAFFEIARDRHLHVNVTHVHPTKSARGWAGPARLVDGFVHNRLFDDAPLDQIARRIREMVFAEPT